MTPEVQHFAYHSLPTRAVNDKTERSIVLGESGTIGHFVYQKGAVIPRHHLVNEQYSLILKGSVVVRLDDREVVVKAGEGIIIPSRASKSVGQCYLPVGSVRAKATSCLIQNRSAPHF